MRTTDEGPMGPEVLAALEACDAALAGEPTAPEHAELAELALILRDERRLPGAEFTTALDERVGRRFARPARPVRTAGRWRRRLYAPGLAVAAAAGVAVVVVLAGGGGGGNGFSGTSSSTAASGQTLSATAASRPASHGAAAGAASGRPGRLLTPDAARLPGAKHAPNGVYAPPPVRSAPNAAASASGSAASPSGSATTGVGGTPPTPTPGGNRQIVQSAEVQLWTAPNQIEYVAQQVFDVVGAENGIVQSSDVTATGGSDGHAEFQLSVPSARLGLTLTALSQMRGAHVLSRTDSTQDITGQVGGAGMRLAEARALRRSLLRQLAAATTAQQVASLKAQIAGADASIASDLASLNGLKRQVAYSSIGVTLTAGSPPVAPAPNSGGSFTLGKAAHLAGRVLVVAAGVALVALAVLVPLGLLVALAAWTGLAIRRRRREQALDLL